MRLLKLERVKDYLLLEEEVRLRLIIESFDMVLLSMSSLVILTSPRPVLVL